jgi:LCP family protein required for cell wall assembly
LSSDEPHSADDPVTEPDSRPAPRRHRLRRTLITVGIVMLTLFVAGGVAAYLAYRNLDQNISAIDPSADLTDRPTKATPTATGANEPLNILLMGSDTRQGQGHGFGNASLLGGARSDTTMLVHLPADRKSALVVSIPRDSMVQIPACKTGDGSTYPAHLGMFNEAFSLGGPGCTMHTVESLTGIYIDHFMVVDFRGFQSMVDALGGIQVCLPTAIDDPKSHLNLPAGISTVHGTEALAYVRARYIGNGSDISRITRQQAFLSSVVNKVRSAGTLLNPIKLYKFLDAATKSLTTDPSLAHLSALRDLADQVRSIPPSKITFMTTPWMVDPSDPNRVVWDTAKTNPLWKAIKTDAAYPPPAPKPTIMDQRPLTTAPSDIAVEVLNGSGQSFAATRAAAKLRAQGYQVYSVGDAATSDYVSTVVQYSRGMEDAARTLAASIPGSSRVLVDGLGTTVQVVVGKQWPGVVPVVVKKVTEPSSGIRTANQSICKISY